MLLSPFSDIPPALLLALPFAVREYGASSPVLAAVIAQALEPVSPGAELADAAQTRHFLATNAAWLTE